MRRFRLWGWIVLLGLALFGCGGEAAKENKKLTNTDKPGEIQGVGGDGKTVVRKLPK